MTRPTALVLLLLAGCTTNDFQNALQPAGPQAERSAALFWIGLGVAVVVCVLVALAVLGAAWAARRRGAPMPDAEADRRLPRLIGAAVAATVVVLAAWLAFDVAAGRGLTALARDDAARRAGGVAPVTIEIVGRQWWWEATYAAESPHRRLTTANEIYVPVGRPVVLRMTSRDVIHSFWVPNVTGKRDLIPGHVSTLWFQADSAGVYRGQCAEFCGHQHAKMGLLLIAVPPERFAEWYEAHLRPAAPPTDSLRRRGLDVFLGAPCVTCHRIGGTPAGGRVGPDLTHVGSRRTLAAASLPNTRGHLAGWILDPQRIKPGTRMPPNQLAPADLHALLAYLEGLR